MGKPWKEEPKRNKKGRYSKSRGFMKVSVAVILIAFFGYIGIVAIAGATSKTEYITQVETRDTLAEKVEVLKADLMTNLHACESNSIPSDEMSIGNLVTYDPDPRQPSKQVPSFGVMKFKSKTLIDYHKMFYNEILTPEQSVFYALDDKKAMALAEKIIFEDPTKGINNWHNCVHSEKNIKLYHLADKLKVIKSLTK